MLINDAALTALPSRPFPGAGLNGETEAQSHRRLTMPGTTLRGAWTDTEQYYESDTEAGVLKCKWVCWVELSGSIHHVPPGRWEVELLLQHGGNAITKPINWYLHVDGGGERSTVQFVTDQTRPLEFDVRDQWVFFCMGAITVKNPGSRVQLSIQGYNNKMVSNLSFGGLVLKPCSVDWKREAILLRSAFRTVTMQEAPASTNSFLSLPQNVVVLIAQYLITPLPQETMLLP